MEMIHELLRAHMVIFKHMYIEWYVYNAYRIRQMGDYAHYNLMLWIYKCSRKLEKLKKKSLCIFPVKLSHLLWINWNITVNSWHEYCLEKNSSSIEWSWWIIKRKEDK